MESLTTNKTPNKTHTKLPLLRVEKNKKESVGEKKNSQKWAEKIKRGVEANEDFSNRSKWVSWFWNC